MSIYLSIDQSEPAEISSNTGWSQFIEWAQSLPEEYNDVLQLAEHGITEQPEAVGDQLRKAMSEEDVPEDVEAIIESIREHLTSAEDDSVVTINNGMSAADDEET